MKALKNFVVARESFKLTLTLERVIEEKHFAQCTMQLGQEIRRGIFLLAKKNLNVKDSG